MSNAKRTRKSKRTSIDSIDEKALCSDRNQGLNYMSLSFGTQGINSTVNSICNCNLSLDLPWMSRMELTMSSLGAVSKWEQQDSKSIDSRNPVEE